MIIVHGTEPNAEYLAMEANPNSWYIMLASRQFLKFKMSFNLLFMVLYRKVASTQHDSIFCHYTSSPVRSISSFGAFSPVSILGYSWADGVSLMSLATAWSAPSYGLTSKRMLCHQVAYIFACFRNQDLVPDGCHICHLIRYIINYTEKRIIWLDPSIHAPVFFDLARPLLGGYLPKKFLSHNTKGAIRYDPNIHLVG